jgi:glycosyltransferase involved in cell wall biosynthesis
VAIAKGEWVLFLDSDDELVPGALRAVQSEIEAAHASIDGIWFRCQRDDGRLSPDPFPAWRLLDYEGHLRFMQLTVNGSTDMMKVCRRATFDHVRYPNNRALESGYHLDFAKRFVSIISETVARFYHQDAPNQLTATLTRLRARDRSFNLDMLEAYRDLFAKHGESLRRLAPSVMDRYLEKATILALNVGYRGLAAKLILKRAWFGKVDFKSVLMFGVGFVSPDLLDWARRTITR